MTLDNLTSLKIICSLAAPLDPKFTSSQADIVAELKEEAGVVVPCGTNFRRTHTQKNGAAVVQAEKGTNNKLFILKVALTDFPLTAFTSGLSFASVMRCPIILKLNGEMLMISIYESNVDENTAKVKNFLTGSLGL